MMVQVEIEPVEPVQPQPVQVALEPNNEPAKVARLMLTASLQSVPGRKADVSMVSLAAGDKAAVMVYDRAVRSGLFYRVGSGRKDSCIVNWGEEHTFCNRRDPSVALILHEGRIYALAVVCRGWAYHIGEVGLDDKEITWRDPVRFRGCSAVLPKVSASSNGTVAIVHERSYSFSKMLQIHIGKFVAGEFRQMNSHQVEGPGMNFCCEVPSLRGVEPDVAINDRKVVIVCKSGFNALRTIVGEYARNNDNTYDITWGNVVPLPLYDCRGIHPSISINDGDSVVATHQSKTLRRISRLHGVLAGRCVDWSTDRFTKATIGEYPTIALAEDGYVIEAHKTNFGTRLFISEGKLETQRPAQ